MFTQFRLTCREAQKSLGVATGFAAGCLRALELYTFSSFLEGEVGLVFRFHEG